MPLLDHHRLHDDRERRLAFTLLSFMGNAYVWRGSEAGVSKVTDSCRLMMTSSNGNFFPSLALCAGNSPVAGEFPLQRLVARSFDVFCDLRLNKVLSSNCAAGDFRRHRNHYDVTITVICFGLDNSWDGCVLMLTSPYLPQSLCSPVPMFLSPDVPRPYIPQFLYSPVPFFPHEVRPIFPSLCVSQSICFPVPMFSSPIIPQSRYSP